MSDQAINSPEAPTEGKTGKIVRVVLQWTILGVLVFTCVMAAARKFGG